MAISKGEWKRYGQHIHLSDTNTSDEIVTVLCPAWMSKEEARANADIIVAAVNACQEVNPDNPMAVAESIKDMYEALKVAFEKSHNPEVEIILMKAIAKAERRE